MVNSDLADKFANSLTDYDVAALNEHGHADNVLGVLACEHANRILGLLNCGDMIFSATLLSNIAHVLMARSQELGSMMPAPGETIQ